MTTLAFFSIETCNDGSKHSGLLVLTKLYLYRNGSHVAHRRPVSLVLSISRKYTMLPYVLVMLFSSYFPNKYLTLFLDTEEHLPASYAMVDLHQCVCVGGCHCAAVLYEITRSRFKVPLVPRFQSSPQDAVNIGNAQVCNALRRQVARTACSEPHKCIYGCLARMKG